MEESETKEHSTAKHAQFPVSGGLCLCIPQGSDISTGREGGVKGRRKMGQFRPRSGSQAGEGGRRVAEINRRRKI